MVKMMKDKNRIYIGIITILISFILIFENAGYALQDIVYKASLRKPLDNYLRMQTT